jgi:hypothetical protein
MFPKELYKKRYMALKNKKDNQVEGDEDEEQEQDVIKEFFNMHFTRKMDDPEVMFIEKIDFLV